MPSLIPEMLTNPGTHVLVIGVSRYRHLPEGDDPTPKGLDSGLEQLHSAAGSAAAIALWLLKREYLAPLPQLASLRLLLSPAADELIDPEIGKLGAAAATEGNVRTAVIEFTEVCARHRDNHAVVYVAGHGVQLSKSGAVLLLEDFAGPGQLNQLQAALDLTSFHASMNHARCARHQFWFADICRQVPAIARRFETMTAGIKPDFGEAGAAESTPMFLAAITGTAAYGVPGGRSLFCDALLWLVELGGAAVGKDADVAHWHVPVSQLTEKLPARVRALALAKDAEQRVENAGMPNPAVFHVYDEVPQARLEVDLKPEEALAVSRSTLLDENLVVVFKDRADWPLVAQVGAGLYQLIINSEAPFTLHQRLLTIAPPVYRHEALLS